MILHIAPDNKFIPFLQDVFEEALPAKNVWRVVTDLEPIFVNISTNMQLVGTAYFDTENFDDDLKLADCLILHSLFISNRSKLPILKKVPQSMPVVWRGWGFDYYKYLDVKGLNLLLPETRALTEELKAAQIHSTRSWPRSLAYRAKKELVEKFVSKKLVERIDYFSCCIPEDFEVLKQALPELKGASFLPLNYYSKEDVFLRGEGLKDLSGRDILLGNSSTASNNHIEAMRVLSKLDLENRRVIVPLSYGDMSYRERIVELGNELLGAAFMPISSYMPLEEYNNLISSCSNVVMNHVRQQAIGNISAALLRGGKVFLRSENPIYKYYTQMGVRLFEFDENIDLKVLDEPLSASDVHTNKEIMSHYWTRECAIEQAKAFVELERMR